MFLLLLAAAATANAQDDAVVVIGVTPVPGLGVPAERMPANVQTYTWETIRDRGAATVPEGLGRSAASTSFNEIQGNPFQPDLAFRGFAASPLLGVPQGLSLYQDGVRINAPFGDVVHWDLVPMRALDTLALLPGSNPLFGLNTLGGALSARTKDGRRHPGTTADLIAGSFGRRETGFQHGRAGRGTHFFIAGTLFEEDGWRDFAPSEVRQLFGKLGGGDGERLDWDLSLTLVDNDLIGNGLAPQSFLGRRREAIFTHPDSTRNRLAAPALSARYAPSAAWQLGATLYARRLLTDTLNGDVNDEFEDGPNDLAAGGTGANIGTAVHNRTATRQDGAGGALQWTLFAERRRLALGAMHDRSRSRFSQSAELGVFDATRGVIVTDPRELENALRGRTRSSGLYVVDVFTLRPGAHLTLAARYNRTAVSLADEGPSAPALDGEHRFSRLNKAVGFAVEPGARPGWYAGYAEANRAPTPIELGCADPARPCTLPNALAADPPLHQVVARTLEAGLRGRAGGVRWNAGLFRSENRDDILFVGTTTSAGFFRNFGRTRREGAELGASGRLGTLQWSAGYSLVRASFRSGACIVSENNSSRGTSPACSPEVAPGVFEGDDLTEVQPGDRIPGVPEHSFKLSLDTEAAPRLRVSADLQAFSSQYARGNENNEHQPGDATDLNGETRTFGGSGRAAGYAVVNLAARYDLGGGWQLFARVNNVFDRRYASAAALAENPFDANGTFITDSGAWTRDTFYAPGAPRAGWIGLRYGAE